MKKFLSVALVFILLFSFACIGLADSRKLVVCGDSIAQGYGIQNPAEASYGKILADTLGCTYKNFGKDGDRSEDLLRKLNTNHNGVCNYIKTADFVLISIGGNDFIKPKTELLNRVVPALFGVTDNVDAVGEQFAENFAQIIAKLKALNPKAQIVVQTVYNGHKAIIGRAYELATSRVNAAIRDYLSNNEGAYIIADTVPAFENHREYIAVDTLHPSALGNVAIAQVILDALYENGLSQTTELTVNAKGVDQIDGFSYTLKEILDFFRNIFKIFDVFKLLRV